MAGNDDRGRQKRWEEFDNRPYEAVPDAAGLFGTPGPGQLTGLERSEPAQPLDATLPQQGMGDVPAGGDDFAGGFGIAGMYARIQAVSVKIIESVAPPAIRILQQDAAVRGGEQVAVFVSGEKSLDQTTVGLGKIGNPFARRCAGEGRRSDEEYGQNQRQEPLTDGFRFHIQYK